MTGDKSQADVETAERGSRHGEMEAGDEAIAEHRPSETALVLDAMLGKLSTYLRMCGYDATYTTGRGYEDEGDVLALAHTEGRIVVTRDRELAQRADRSVVLSTRDVADQLRELQAAGFALRLADEPVRCSAYNGLLEGVDRTEPTPEYAADPHEQPVWRCRECGQHFWKGSHWDDVAATLEGL
jgi:uncharacterized protein with PIN domain